MHIASASYQDALALSARIACGIIDMWQCVFIESCQRRPFLYKPLFSSLLRQGYTNYLSC